VSSMAKSFSEVRPIEKRLVSTATVLLPKPGGSVSVRRDGMVYEAIVH
jgi:hypothetical protein